MKTLRARLIVIAAIFILASALCLLVEAMQAPADWPQWRGPNRDGISKETGLLKQWPAGGPPLAWKIGGAGTGYSSFSVSQGRLFTMGAKDRTEFIIAFDAATGKQLWATQNGRRFSNDKGDGPRGTPTIDGEQLYALGGSGDLTCLDVRTGKVIWTLNVLQKFGGSNIQWGLSESPLVLSDRLLVNAGGRGASIVALNKKDGALIWKSQNDEAGYSSAVTANIGGVIEAIFFTGDRALGVDIRDGRLLWDYKKASNGTANVATPIVHNNRVFVSSDYGTGCALLELKPQGNGVTAQEVYFNKDMKNHHSSSVLIGDYLYGFSSSTLTALNFNDGKVAWRDRSVGKGSLVYADGHLYCYSENGVVGLVEATPAGYREKGRFQIQQGSLPTWSHPVVAGGRLYLRDQDTVYCYDVREKKSAASQ